MIITQSAATAHAYASRHRETLNENADLMGLSAANAAAALSGTFVVNGSPTQTAMVESSGGRSQLAHLITAGVVALVLLFLTGPLQLSAAVRPRRRSSSPSPSGSSTCAVCAIFCARVLASSGSPWPPR